MGESSMTLPEEFPAAAGTPIEPPGQGGPSAGAGPIGQETAREAGRRLIGVEESISGGRPIGPSGGFGRAGEVIRPIGVERAPTISAPTAAIVSFGASISPLFNIEGAPIAIFGGVFSGGLPIGGPVTQIFRGGSAPVSNTLFINTLSPAGPIQQFFIGSGGAPIGIDTFGGGALPIGPAEEIALAIQSIGPRTALVWAPAIVFGSELPQGGGPI
jgi:hypothetical protein